jgi:hypothetical protein
MQMVINIFAAIGFKITGIIIHGLIVYGSWLFLILAFLGIFVTGFLGADDRDAGSNMVKKIAAILAATALFYLPVQLNLTNVIAGAPGNSVSSLKTDLSNDPILKHSLNYSSGATGAVNAITYLAYTLSHPIVDLAMRIGGSNTDIWPGIQSSIDADLSSAMQANNPQVAANLAQWRYVLAPAILRADPVLATALEKVSRLKYVFFNPYSTNATLDPVYGDNAAVVKDLLKKYPPSKPTFQEIVLQNQSELAKVAGEFGAKPFTANESSSSSGSSTPASVTVKLFGKHLWEENQDAAKETSAAAHNFTQGNTEFFDAINPQFLGLGGQSAAGQQLTNYVADMDTDLEDFFGGSSYTSGTKQFSNLEDLYVNLGRSVLVASLEGFAKNPKSMAALRSMCASHGAADCVGTLSMFANSIRRPDIKMGQTPGVSGFFGKTLSDLGSFTITGLIEIVFYSIGAMFNVAAPYIIGFAMAGAIVVSVIGPLWMLLAGRFLHAMEWMIMPVVFVNVWDALFYIWVLFCNALDNVMPGLGSAIDASGGIGVVKDPDVMNHIVTIGEAMGFLAIPTAAFFLLFGKPGDAMRNNFGRAMAAGMATATTLVGMQVARMGLRGGGKRPDTGGKRPRVPGTGAGGVTANAPAPTNPKGPGGPGGGGPSGGGPGGAPASISANAPATQTGNTPHTIRTGQATGGTQPASNTAPSTASGSSAATTGNSPQPAPVSRRAMTPQPVSPATPAAPSGGRPAAPMAANSPHTIYRGRTLQPATGPTRQPAAPQPPAAPKQGNTPHTITQP